MAVPQPGMVADSVNLASDERSAVVEGLARIIAGLPEDSAEPVALQLVSPMIVRAQSLALAGVCIIMI